MAAAAHGKGRQAPAGSAAGPSEHALCTLLQHPAPRLGTAPGTHSTEAGTTGMLSSPEAPRRREGCVAYPSVSSYQVFLIRCCGLALTNQEWLDEWLCLALQVLALSLLSHELGTRPPVPTHRPGPSVTPISSLNSYHSLGFCCSDLTGSKPGAGPCLLYTEWLCCQHPEDGGVRRWGLWEGRG